MFWFFSALFTIILVLGLVDRFVPRSYSLSKLSDKLSAKDEENATDAREGDIVVMVDGEIGTIPLVNLFPDVRLHGEGNASANAIRIRAPANLTANRTVIWPANVGASGDVLKMGSDGALEWAPETTATGVSGGGGESGINIAENRLVPVGGEATQILTAGQDGDPVWGDAPAESRYVPEGGGPGLFLTSDGEGAHSWAAASEDIPALPFEFESPIPPASVWSVVEPTLNETRRAPGRITGTTTLYLRASSNIDGDGEGGSPPADGDVYGWSDAQAAPGPNKVVPVITSGKERPIYKAARRDRFNNNPTIKFTSNANKLTHTDAGFDPTDEIALGVCIYAVYSSGRPYSVVNDTQTLFRAGEGSVENDRLTEVTLHGYVNPWVQGLSWNSVSAQFNHNAAFGTVLRPEPHNAGYNTEERPAIFVACSSEGDAGSIRVIATAGRTFDDMPFMVYGTPATGMNLSSMADAVFSIGDNGGVSTSCGFGGNLAEIGFKNIQRPADGLSDVDRRAASALLAATEQSVIFTHLALRYGITPESASDLIFSSGLIPLNGVEARVIFGVSRDDAGGLYVREGMSAMGSAPKIAVSIATNEGDPLRGPPAGISYYLLTLKDPAMVMEKGWMTNEFTVYASGPARLRLKFVNTTTLDSTRSSNDALDMGLDGAMVTDNMNQTTYHPLSGDAEPSVVIYADQGTRIRFVSTSKYGTRGLRYAIIASPRIVEPTTVHELPPACKSLDALFTTAVHDPAYPTIYPQQGIARNTDIVYTRVSGNFMVYTNPGITTETDADEQTSRVSVVLQQPHESGPLRVWSRHSVLECRRP